MLCIPCIYITEYSHGVCDLGQHMGMYVDWNQRPGTFREPEVVPYLAAAYCWRWHMHRELSPGWDFNYLIIYWILFVCCGDQLSVIAYRGILSCRFFLFLCLDFQPFCPSSLPLSPPLFFSSKVRSSGKKKEQKKRKKKKQEGARPCDTDIICRCIPALY